MGCTIDFFRSELYRIAWRMQYKVRVQYKYECSYVQEISPTISFIEQTDNRLLLESLFKSMPAHIGKQIILDFYINDKSEKQIAQELNISQQAVNKWKKKMLHTLNQKMSF